MGLTSAMLPTNAIYNFNVSGEPVNHDSSLEDDRTVDRLSIQKGGGTPVPTLPPYRVARIWRRTA